MINKVLLTIITSAILSLVYFVSNTYYTTIAVAEIIFTIGS